MDMGVEDYLLASTLKGVLAQRLVRKLCSHCAEAADAHEQFRALAEQVSLKFGQEMLKKPVGCSDCRGTGFSGRTTVSEFLRITPAIREHIRSRAPEGAVTHDAVAGGMHTLLADGLRLVAEGTTTIAEVLEVVGVS
jgi:general secretion pathway protein E